eukprot:scaffold446_cov183-Ochromonas_danica.AAC.19
MDDENDEANFAYAEETARLEEEINNWKAKYKQLELKKKESELSLNKIKTEINALRSVDKQWKDGAKSTFLNVLDVQHFFAAQCEQIMSSLAVITKTSERIQLKASFLKKVKAVIAQLQAKVAMQEETIGNLQAQIKVLTVELEDKTKKVERLSEGIEEEVERLVKPMREKLADTIVTLMKEKAARAQERRDLAALWPDDHLMPTLLMKSRALSAEEKEKRLTYAKEQNANLALSLEIRANVSEARMWQIKYDDYGRPFFEHSKNGQTMWEAPEIMSYQPPPGRDEMGNLISSEEAEESQWQLCTDSKGQIYYKHKVTQEESLLPPAVYKRLPRGRSKEEQVSQAASQVLAFIKEKITRHIAIKKKRKERLENPLTPEQKKKKEKERKNMSPEELAQLLQEEGEEEEKEGENLWQYQYDIETVEMLANQINPDFIASGDKDPEVFRAEQRSFLQDQAVRTFPEDLFEDLRLIEVDLQKVTTDQLRGMVEQLALKEEKLEVKLEKTRENLKDFSAVLVDKIREEEVARVRKQNEERRAREAERIEKRKQLLEERAKQREAARQKRRIEKEQAAAATAAVADGGESEQKGGEGDEATLQEDDKTAEEDATASAILESRESATYTADGEKEDDEEKRKNMGHSLLPLDGEEDEDDDWSDDEEGTADISKVVGGAGTRLAFGDEDDLETVVTTAIGTTLFSELPLDDHEADHTPMMPNVTNDLVNFAIFCGFNNLQMESSTAQSNHLYSLYTDIKAKNVMHGGGKANDDDEWLTCNFFLGCSKDKLDRCFEGLMKDYESNNMGLLPIPRPHDETVVKYETPHGQVVERDEAHGYLSSIRHLDDNPAMQSFHLWKSQQLMTEVVQHQLNQEEVKRLLALRDQSYSVSLQTQLEEVSTHRTMEAELEMRKLRIEFERAASPFKGSLYYVQLFFGSMMKQSEKVMPIVPKSLDFPVLTFPESVSINDLQLHEVMIELIDQQQNSVEHFYVGKGSHALDGLVGGNFNRWITLLFPLYNNDHQEVCKIEIELRAKLIWKEIVEEIRDKQDPYNLKRLEQLLPGNREVTDTSHHSSHRFNNKNDMQHQPLTKQLLNQYDDLVINRNGVEDEEDADHDNDREDWEKAVSELRGDAKISAPPSTPGTAPSADASTVSMDESSSQLMLDGYGYGQHQYPKALKVGLAACEKKIATHQVAIQSLSRQLEDRKHNLDDLIKQKQDYLNRLISDNRNQHKKLTFQATDLRDQITSIQKAVADLRRPHPEPKEPEFEDLGPVPYVPMVHLPPQLDGRGKKKKAIPNDQLKTLIEQIEQGQCDGKEILPGQGNEGGTGGGGGGGIRIPEPFYPNQGQLLKINKAREARNSILDNQREQELKRREHLMELYRVDHQHYLDLEETRNKNLNKACKDSRKIFLKYNHLVERIENFEEELRGYDLDIQSMQDLLLLHQRSMANYKVMVLKYMLEFQRQQNHIQALKQKLNKLLNARRYLLEYPAAHVTSSPHVNGSNGGGVGSSGHIGNASTSPLPASSSSSSGFDQCIIQDQCSRQLKLLRLEIYTVKTLLVQEGLKMRHLITEEEAFYSHEVHRIDHSIEIIQQRFLFDSLIITFKVNATQTYNDLLKYKLVEAQGDDEGVDTIEDLKEAYHDKKIWKSPEIEQAQQRCDLLDKKIAMIYEFTRSTGKSQTMLINTLYQSHTYEQWSLRDGFVEYSDYERAQYLTFQCLQMVKKYRFDYEKKKSEVTPQLQRYQSEQILIRQEMDNHLLLHERETQALNNNTQIILTSLRDFLHNYREQTNHRLEELESNVISLSKECQKIREDLLSQQMIYNEKIKILWAFIHTLQTSLQQLTAKLEITMEENEKIVIQSKLMADQIRSSLRKERQHSANLYFILHSQKGLIRYLYDVIQKTIIMSRKKLNENKQEKEKLKREIYQQVFTVTTLSTNIDLLFEFFVSRIANLAGANVQYNDQLAVYHTPQLLAILCRYGNHSIKYYAAKALGNIGWNSFVERRILVWDALTYWKDLRTKALDFTAKRQQQQSAMSITKHSEGQVTELEDEEENIDQLDMSNIYQTGWDIFNKTSNVNSIVSVYNNLRGSNRLQLTAGAGGGSNPLSLRTYIKQRRQWALRANKRREGPSYANQKLLNIRDQVLPILFELSIAENKELSFTIEELQEIIERNVQEPGNTRLDLVLENLQRIEEVVTQLSHSKRKNPLIEGNGHNDLVLLGTTTAERMDNLNLSTSISRSAALAIAVSSYEPSNHTDILSNYLSLYALLLMVQRGGDVEIQTHAAITIANLSYKNEYGQSLFGALQLIPPLIQLMFVPIADVLEAVTAALANLTSYHDVNCHRFIESHGIDGAIHVLYHAKNNENLLDCDQGDEIQANAAELLTNISRYATLETLPFFNETVINNLILLCAASNIQCKRYIPLILGNISQSSELRHRIGQLGGIEALFLALENEDHIVKCNILWALSNLMYYPPNQERAGRFMTEVTHYLFISNLPYYTENIRIHAAVLLGNMVYYNTANRIRFLEIDQALETLFFYLKNKDCSPILEGCLRILLSLSYLDRIALFLGQEAGMIPVLLSYLSPPSYSNNITKYVLEVLSNLCLHHANRKVMYEEHGIDILVPLQAHQVEEIRTLGREVVSHLEDITPEEVLARKREALPIERVVALASHSDPLVRAVAAEQMGEHLYRQSTNTLAPPLSSTTTGGTGGGAGAGAITSMEDMQKTISSLGGLDSLLAIANHPDEPAVSLLPALWSLRNLLVNNFDNQSQFHYRDGVQVLCKVLDSVMERNIYQEDVEKVIEGVLICLLAATQRHDRNARRLVMIGLESILSLTPQQQQGGKNKKRTQPSPASPERKKEMEEEDIYVRAALQSETIQALVHNLLLQLGPYNYVVCGHCQRKQDLHGTNCLYCGHRLLVDASEINMQQAKAYKSRSVRAGRHGDSSLGAEENPSKPHSANALGVSSPERDDGRRVRMMSQSARMLPTVGGGGWKEMKQEEQMPSGVMMSASTGQLPPLETNSAQAVQGGGGGGVGLSKFSLARSLPSKSHPIPDNNNNNNNNNS